MEKPSPAFFARVIEEAGCAAGSVLYVGDRLDNDIGPAQHAGMSTALIRRGPWGFIVEDETVSSRCLFRLLGLSELPGLIRAHNARQGLTSSSNDRTRSSSARACGMPSSARRTAGIRPWAVP